MKQLRWKVLGLAGLVVVACGGSSRSSGRDDPDANEGTAGSEAAPGNGTTPNDADTGKSPDEAGEDSKEPAAGWAGAPGTLEDGTPVGAIGTGATVGTVSIAGGPGMASGGGAVRVGPGIMGPGMVDGLDSLAEAPEAENCEPEYESASSDFCDLQLTCDNDNIYASCYNQYNGSANQWWCDCGSNYGYVSVELSGVQGSTACAVMSEVCTSREVPTFSEEETCSTDYQSASVDYCAIQERCSQTAELADGVQALLSRYNYADCYTEGTNGELYCYCSDNMTSGSYRVSGTRGTAACELALDLCSGDVAVEFDDSTTTCQTDYQSAGNGYCELNMQCSQSGEVSDTVTALQYDYRYASCQDGEDGTSNCSCQSTDRSMRFDIEVSTTDMTACTTALDVCTAEDELVLDGPITCERQYQSASGDYCDTQLACTQSGTVGDRSLVAYGDLWASCQVPTSGSTATCTCSSGSTSEGFEVDAADAWDLCSVAAERCPELLEVQIGQGGGYYYGPTRGAIPL